LVGVGRSKGPFGGGFADPNSSRQYSNVPVHTPDGDGGAVPFSPMGFADIAGGLRGSRSSLDRVPSNDRVGPTAVGGSNRSLNRSQDSASGAGAVNPRTRGRDAAVARDSNRSLNRSVLLATVHAFSP